MLVLASRIFSNAVPINPTLIEKTPQFKGFRVKDRARTGGLWIHKPAL